MPAQLTWKINGRPVSKREWDAHSRRRNRIYGDKLAEMLDSQAPPTIRTNDTFMRGKKQGGDPGEHLGMDPVTFELYKQRAQQAGVDITGKFYFGTVANKPGDPEAWCGSDSDVIAKAKKEKMLLEIKGTTYDFRDKYVDLPDDEPYAVAQDIVDRHVGELIEEEYDGHETPKIRAELEERVRKEITPTDV